MEFLHSKTLVMTEEFDKFEIDGVVYKTMSTKKWKERKNWEKPNSNNLFSHIPGTIVEIDVKEGQTVKKGDLLLILQAMKMNNKILAPFNARIKKICIELNSQIPKSELMIVLEDI